MWWMPLTKESVRNLFLWSYINFFWTANLLKPLTEVNKNFPIKKKKKKSSPKQKNFFFFKKVSKNPASIPVFIQQTV